MFGYLRPFVPEMKVAEYEIYRAVYCGVCREIGRTSSQPARLGLSYDIVLLCAVRMALTGEMPVFRRRMCPAHPMTRRSVLEPCEASRFTAAAFALLFAAKNDDDLMDEKGARKARAIALSPLAAHMKKSGGRWLPDGAAENIAELLGKLSRLEKEKSPSSDETSDAFGEVLGYIFSLGLDGERQEVARAIGRCAGKFVYMCDAVDDLAEDAKKGRYNALSLGWGELALDGDTPSPIVRDAVSTATMLSLDALGEAVESLDPTHPMTPVIKHIAYVGMPASLERVFDGKKNTRSLRTVGDVERSDSGQDKNSES